MNHDEPVIVGVRSTAGIYYGLCRKCGARTAIEASPELAARRLAEGAERSHLPAQEPLPCMAAENATGRKGEKAWAGAA